VARIAIGIEDVNQSAGQERVVCELIKRLAERHEIDLYSYTAVDVPEGTVRVIHVRNPFEWSNFLRSAWFVPATSRCVRASEYDIVLSQGANMGNQNFVLAHTCQALRRDLIYNRHWPRDRPGWAHRLEQRMKWDLWVALERKTMRRCRGRIFAIDELRRRALVEYHGLDDGDVTLAENGVDHERFHPGLRERWRAEVRRRLGLDPRSFVVLFVGGLWEEKGLAVIMEALARLKHRGARLVVVGRGDERDWSARAGALGIGERVVFLGHVPEPEQYYGAADCFAFLSLCEGLSLAQLEAAAAGLPIVSLQGNAPEALVEDGVSGYLAPYEPGLMARRLDTLAADPDLCRQMGEASHERSLRYTWDRQAQIIDEAFQAYLEDR
jgi:glycosyltransferase involved in cell wall biosynthesis